MPDYRKLIIQKFPENERAEFTENLDYVLEAFTAKHVYSALQKATEYAEPFVIGAAENEVGELEYYAIDTDGHIFWDTDLERLKDEF